MVKRVKREAKGQDAYFGPVDDSRNLSSRGVGEDIPLAKVALSEDQRVLSREKGREAIPNLDNEVLEARGEPTAEVVEAGAAVFEGCGDGLRFRRSTLLPRLCKETISFSARPLIRLEV